MHLGKCLYSTVLFTGSNLSYPILPYKLASCQHSCLCTGGAPPTDITAEQTGVSAVLVTWTAPSPPPTDWYQVQITSESTIITVNVAETSYTQSSLQHGVYSFQVKSLTQHFPSEATEPIEFTVRGKFVVLCYKLFKEEKHLKFYRSFATSYLYSLTHCHISHHHLDSA